jgi:hypothetical protein
LPSEICEIHPFEVADDRCGSCGRTYCRECIVYPFGPRKPPMCKACAITAAGIRKNAQRAPLATRRQIKRQIKARKKHEKQQSKVRTDEGPATAPTEPAASEQPGRQPAPKARRRKAALDVGVAAGTGTDEDDGEQSIDIEARIAGHLGAPTP